MPTEATTFWRELDDLREIALANDLERANLLLGRIERSCHVGDPAIDAARTEMMDLLARTFGLSRSTPAEAGIKPETAADLPEMEEGELPGIAPGGAEGISLVTCCMNREKNLLRALESWIACTELTEIVIVDWSSDRPVRAALAESGIRDPRIRVIRVEGEPRWILSYAFNAGFRAASCARILKADADIVLDADFFAKNPLEPGQFIAGNWRTAAEGQSHVNGFFYLHKAALAAVAGFNEHITTYGWDDDDLYDRLEQQGTQRRDVAAETIYHLPHSDEERMGTAAAPAVSGLAELRRNTMLKIRTNRILAHLMPYWNQDKTVLPFKIVKGGSGDLVLRRSGWEPHPVPAQIAADAEFYALLELTSWRLGQRVLGLSRERLTQLLERPFSELGRLDVEVALGNRPETLNAQNGYLVVRCGPDGITVREAEAFSALQALARDQGLGLVLSGPAPELPATAAAPARACAFVPDWENIGLLEPVDLPRLRAGRGQPGRWLAELTWSPDLAAALTAPAAPALAAGRARVYADGQHGLGNRLRAIGSAAAIAEKTDRELVVVWQPDAHCDCRFSDLFDYDGAVIEESFPGEAAARGCHLYNYMEVEEGARKDAEIRDSGGDLYLRSAYVLNSPLSSWENENRFLRALSPVDAVRAMVAGVRTPNDVSAHVRMAGGGAYEHLAYESAAGNWTEEGHAQIAHWREKSHFSHFMKRLDMLSADGRADRIFLAADAPETYAAFQACYGDRLAMLGREIYDRSAEQLLYALADALLLGSAPRLLGSTWSSFSELALRLAPHKMTVEMSGTDF